MGDIDFDPPAGVDDSLLTPLFHEDPGTSSSSNSSGSPRRHDEWSLPSYFSPNQSAKSPSKPPLINIDDISFSSLLQSSSANHMHPWATMDMDTTGDITMSTLISEESQYAIDPSSLHFGASYDPSAQSVTDAMFQFTVTQPYEETQVSQLPTSAPPSAASTSSESRDASPSPEHTPSPSESISSVNPTDLHLYAQRAIEATGVLLALKAPQQSNQSYYSQPLSPVSQNDAQVPQAKVPIPRLRPTAPSTPSIAQVKQSPKLGSLPTPPEHPLPQYAPASHAPQPITKTGRPKTSHTTIERRYRTNLNARILALKRAVPALRILEKNTPQPQQGKGLTGASASRWDFNDVVNERGYVDGVKAAKKNSKGVVLGKAVEYIKALKRRETRLKHKADGLRALITGLVGGHELLQEWERDWRARFGGEETDEVEEGEGTEEGDEDDEGEGEDEDEEEADGRSKKRRRGDGNASSTPPVVVEKRKRGRPRKNPLPGATTPPIVSTATQPQDGALPHLTLHPASVQQQQQQSTFFLAGILLFNFFWTDSSATSTAGHEGTVLTHAMEGSTKVVSSWPLTLSQFVNLVALIMVLIRFVGPSVTRMLASEVKDTADDTPDILDAKLEVGSTSQVAKAVMQRILPFGGKNGGNVMQLNAWRTVAGDLVCQDAAMSTSMLKRAHAYLAFSNLARSNIISPGPIPSDYITLAFLIRPFSLSRAVAWWDKAKKAHSSTDSSRDAAILEEIVLDLGMEKAGDVLASAMAQQENKVIDPVQAIASYVVKEQMREAARGKFVNVVLETAEQAQSSSSLSHKQLLSASYALGSQFSGLARLLDKLHHGCAYDDVVLGPSSPIFDAYEADLDFEFGWSSAGSSSSDSGSDEDLPRTDEVTRLFLIATLLYMRVRGSKGETKEGLTLRRALANEAFDDEEVEEARDKVVDLLAGC